MSSHTFEIFCQNENGSFRAQELFAQALEKGDINWSHTMRFRKLICMSSFTYSISRQEQSRPNVHDKVWIFLQHKSKTIKLVDERNLCLPWEEIYHRENTSNYTNTLRVVADERYLNLIVWKIIKKIFNFFSSSCSLKQRKSFNFNTANRCVCREGTRNTTKHIFTSETKYQALLELMSDFFLLFKTSFVENDNR